MIEKIKEIIRNDGSPLPHQSPSRCHLEWLSRAMRNPICNLVSDNLAWVERKTQSSAHNSPVISVSPSSTNLRWPALLQALDLPMVGWGHHHRPHTWPDPKSFGEGEGPPSASMLDAPDSSKDGIHWWLGGVEGTDRKGGGGGLKEDRQPGGLGFWCRFYMRECNGPWAGYPTLHISIGDVVWICHEESVIDCKVSCSASHFRWI